MKSYLILHGHFYQPPRENPVTGIIPRQRSAAPYHDWNERITEECYGANSASRILTDDGRVLDIVNNYKTISFNMGPTLIDWLQMNAPDIYGKIIEADKYSLEINNGHGNAIAQGFNHTILPLDTIKDAEIQIHWGIKNFIKHFSREPEGLWLPEAAVNGDIIDILINYGIKFIILSPGQARTAGKNGKSRLKDNMGEIPDSSVPYLLKRKSGEIAVFFYNQALAEGISFNHYLHNADTLYRKLLEYRDSMKGNLLHTATDGEIYGHHEPFGDMCLASLSRLVSEGEDFIFTNYGRYLSENPPVLEVVLEKGEDDKGTSWSCFHGVSRWYKDCGCSTGGQPGWNQKWRTPLREALNYLSGELETAYRHEAEKLSDTPPELLLKEYCEAANRTKTPKEFASFFLRDPSDANTVKLLKLLEGQRMKLLSFTSCGWFFADISGIEPLQNMRYASRALDMYSGMIADSTRERVLQILSSAVSNKEHGITGRDLFLSVEKPYPEGFCASVYFSTGRGKDTYGVFRMEEKKKKGKFILVKTENTLTAESFITEFSMPDAGDDPFRIIIKSHNLIIESLEKLPEDLKDILLESVAEEYVKGSLEKLLKVFKYCRFLGIKVPETLNGNTGKLVAETIETVLKQGRQAMSRRKHKMLMELITLADSLGVSYSRTVSQNIIMEKLNTIRRSRNTDWEFLEQTVQLCSGMGIYCDDIKLQNPGF